MKVSALSRRAERLCGSQGITGTSDEKKYDFSKGKRGAVVPLGAGKTRITIRIDDDILEWFRTQVHRAGGGNYQTLINGALRRFIEQGSIEQTLRRVLREELRTKAKSVSIRASTPR